MTGLTVTPQHSMFIGGKLVQVSGLCFSTTDNIICEFNGIKTAGTRLDRNTAECVTPGNPFGKAKLRVSRDGGVTWVTYAGSFFYGMLLVCLHPKQNLTDVCMIFAI